MITSNCRNSNAQSQFSVGEPVRKSNDLKSGSKPKQEAVKAKILEDRKLESAMVPKPYDDLFIEPAGDYDIVYADYNTTSVFS
uniref:Uncharacterized protein n=1 Tax=Setaria digitata TaxID=48799 RepID=A0A915Q1Y8_9BILA